MINYYSLTERNRVLDERVNDEIASKKRNCLSEETEIITFNVGGKIFSTWQSTITKRIKKKLVKNRSNLPLTEKYYGPTFLETLVNGFINTKFDKNGAIFIDNDPENFRHILSYLRKADTDKEYSLPDTIESLESLLEDAEYYGVDGLAFIIKNYLQFGSSIIKCNQFLDFCELCDFSDKNKWKLLYKGSVDGFASAKFHSRCDGHGNTLTIIKSKNGNIFGGYASVLWDSYSHNVNDKCAFLFSFVNKNNKPIKLAYKNTGNGIYCDKNYGPCFDVGYELFISSDSNLNTLSYSKSGNEFTNIGRDSWKENELLAGDSYFMIEEIEILKKLL